MLIPQQESATERDFLANRAHNQKSSQPKLVLVIDDSPTVRNIVQVCLSRAGYQAKGFHDGVEALQWLVSPQGYPPTLVFLDIGLPKMDGYEVAQHFKVRPQWKDTVVIMLTRRDGLIERLKARLAGAKGYMVKPFKTQEILAVVAAYPGVPASNESSR
ncbi:MAG: response regulator [Ktedonobacteraceae bacterium]|nr:response regulator [Ktedonobacteraceae bacterium]